MTAIAIKVENEFQQPITLHPTAKQQALLADYEILYKSRLASNAIRKEVLSGKAKFGIESSGKELLQIALGNHFKKGDFYSGYYRDQTFMLKMGLASVQNLFTALYADTTNDIFSGGRQMNGHFATPLTNEKGQWLPSTDRYNVTSAIAPLAGHVPRALGIALAAKKFRESDLQKENFSANGNEISFCVVGDATTSEGVFFESVNAACVMQVPIVFVVQDDGYGISVPVEMQTAKGSISKALKGFQRHKLGETGCEIFTARAWNYDELRKAFAQATQMTRKEHVPCIVHIKEVTQGNGHSTSGSHQRYKSKERLQWEKEQDCLVKFESWLLKNNYASIADLENIKAIISKELKAEKKAAWVAYQQPFLTAKEELLALLGKLEKTNPQQEHLKQTIQSLVGLAKGEISHLLNLTEQILYHWPADQLSNLSDIKTWFKSYKKQLTTTYQSNLYSETDQAALKVAIQPAQYAANSPMVNGYEILNQYFDQLFERDNRVYAFGEDVGKIGGVNQCFAGLQAKHGKDRIFDTGIREWTIVGQAIGMAMRGLRPIGEVQYLDYLVYALPALTDDLATLRWRTNGMQNAPAIIRTRGHRLEGIWHSGSPMSMLLGSLRGIYLLTPRNMTQAAGMYNTLMQSDDPAIVIEPLNGYRKKEQLPTNLATFTVPLGMPEILQAGEDITLVTYGSCVAFAQEAVEKLKNYGINVELIDVQTLLPFDSEKQILASIQKTNRVIFFDEDVPSGGTAFMLQQVLEEQKGYQYLDAQPVTISAKAHRPAFGDNGNYASKPGVFEVVSAAVKLMQEAEPERFGQLMELFS